MPRTLKLQRATAGQVVTWDAPAPIADDADVTFAVHLAAGDVSTVMARTPSGTVVAVDAARRSLTVEFDEADAATPAGPAWLDLEAVTIWRVSTSPTAPDPGKRLDRIDLAQPLPRPVSTPLRLEGARFSADIPVAAVATNGTFAWSVDWPGVEKPAPASGTLRVSLRPFSTGLTVHTAEDLVPGLDTARARRPQLLEAQIDATELEIVQRLDARGLDTSKVAGADFATCHAWMVAAVLATDPETLGRRQKRADRLFELAASLVWVDDDQNGRVGPGEAGRKLGRASNFAGPEYPEARHRREDW